MAIIGKIRNYSWLLLAFIGLALLAFILGDFVRKGPKTGGTEFGKVADEKIAYRDFEQKVEEQIAAQKKQSQQDKLDQNTVSQIRQQVWSQMVRETIMNKEVEELGLVVSSDELFDQVQGKEPHQFILQNFSNPQTGQFNPAQVISFLKTLDQQKPEVREQWMQIEQSIKEDRLNAKYNTLISKGIYVTKSQAKRNHDLKNNLVDFRYVALKYTSIPDNSVSVTEEDIKNYYEEHKYEYDQEAGRDMEYVSFDVVASKDDINKVKSWMDNLKPEFEKLTKSEEIEAFVNSNGDSRFDSLFHKKGSLSPVIDSNLYNAPVGTNYGPYEENTAYKMAKLVDVQFRPDSAKARHILIAFVGSKAAGEKTKLTKEQAKLRADSMLISLKKNVKDTALFSNIAKNYSDDPSNKDKGGELGWFTDGAMVKAFNDACFKGKKGDMLVVETDFGYHIIKVTDQTAPVKKIKVAVLDRGMEPSEQTFRAIYAAANQFAAKCPNADAFNKLVTKENLNKKVLEGVKETDYQFAGIESPRELVRWAYQAKKGDVSPIYDVGSKFVIAVLKEAREKGLAPLEQIKTDMELGAKKEKKAIALSEKLSKETAGISDINAIAAKLKTKVDTVSGISFSAFGLPNLGADPKLIGCIYGIKTNVISKPLVGSSCVALVIIDKKANGNPASNLNDIRRQLDGYYQQRSSYEVFNALMKNANIVDNRGKFY